MEESIKVLKAIQLIEEWGGIDGGHHKQWLIDQIARVLIDNYNEWVKGMCNGEDGQTLMRWDAGIAP